MKISSDQLMAPVNKFKTDTLDKNETGSGAWDKVNVRLSDTVELSSKNLEVDRLKKAMQTVPDVRADKVAKLKEQIAAGTYFVDSKDIAAKLVQGWSNLYGK